MKTSVLVLVGLIFNTSAFASANNATYVSVSGADSGNCIQTSPCRSINYARNYTNSGGEIIVSTSGEYAPFVLTRAMDVIAGPGVNAVIAPSDTTTAITIKAGSSDRILLRGLILEGHGMGGTGISGNSAGSIEIQHCTIHNFTGSGVNLSVNALYSFLVSDSTVTSNGTAGVGIQGTFSSGAIVKSVISGQSSSTNSFGIIIFQGGANLSVDISDDTITNNYGGIRLAGSQAHVSRTTIQSANNDLEIDSSSTAFLDGNSLHDPVANSGMIYSYSNNSSASPFPGTVNSIPQR